MSTATTHKLYVVREASIEVKTERTVPLYFSSQEAAKRYCKRVYDEVFRIDSDIQWIVKNDETIESIDPDECDLFFEITELSPA